MKKKAGYIIVLVMIALNLHGQQSDFTSDQPWGDEKTFSIGYSLGLNTMGFKITPSRQNIEVDSLYASKGNHMPGINIHFIASLRLNQFFDIRLLPGISFGQRTINFDGGLADDTVVYSPQKLESSFIECPLLLRYGWRMGNIKPYLTGGINYRYDFYAEDKYRLERPVYLRLSHSDIYYEFGTGIEFYLTDINLSVELKMSNGFRDVLVHEPSDELPQYCNAIESLKSRIWVLSFHFE